MNGNPLLFVNMNIKRLLNEQGEGKVRIRNAKPGWAEEEVILSDRAGEIIPCLLNLYRGEYC